MHDQIPTTSGDDSRSIDPAPESELLIGRIIDGEASLVDRKQFAALADADPMLWRRLALRQQDMALLVGRVEQQLQSTDLIELPQEATGDVAARIRRPSWMIAISGWAAMLALAATWALIIMSGRMNAPSVPSAAPARQNGQSPNDFSFDEHLRQYLKAPFVMGELPPTLLQLEDLSDGRKAMRILRRIEEIAFIPADAVLPVDAGGELTKPPSELRKGMATPGRSQ